MNFNLIRKVELPEIKAEGYLYSHKTGARLIFIKSPDKNKVFSATFKTPAFDNTGVFHILEHCVLCGSKNYDMKDPFNELAKGTLNTYLNAITFQDKTMYPVAGTNEQDFFKMIKVYLDAVFFPMIYEREQSFLQEGWHYTQDENNNTEGFGGIVYSEMSGVYSKAEEILKSMLNEHIFVESGYKYDSGGVPSEIVKLTYEGLLENHKKYYHPSNAYLYLYGNIEPDKYLDYIDKEYLSHFENIPSSIEIKNEPMFKDPIYAEKKTAFIKDEKIFCGLAFLIQEQANPKLAITLEALMQYLFRTNASPLKIALMESGAGEEVLSDGDIQMNKPLVRVIIKNAKKSAREIEEIIVSELEKLVKNGIDKELMEGCLNRMEFSLSEENYGYRPAGLHYNIIMLTSWLYGNDPFSALERRKPLEEIRNSAESNFFESFIERYFLKNPHKVLIELSGSEEKTLGVLTALPGKEEKKKITEALEKLKKYHETTDSNEAIDKIPLINISEINKEPEETPIEIKKDGNLEIAHSNIETNDISYINFIFDTKAVPQNLLGELGVLTILLMKLDTKNFSFEALSKRSSQYLGGISLGFKVFPHKDNMEYAAKLIICTKALKKNISHSFSIVREVIENTLFTDEKHIKTLLTEYLSKAYAYMVSNGNSVSVARLNSYLHEAYQYEEAVSCTNFYCYLKKLVENFDAEFENLKTNLAQVLKCIFSKQNFSSNVIAEDKNFGSINAMLTDFYNGLSCRIIAKANYSFNDVIKNEAFVTSSKVCYNSAAFLYKTKSIGSNGYLKVLSNILCSDYLMEEIRIKGGAYGLSCSFSHNGIANFYSYRDPNLKRTYDVYENVINYLRDLSLDQKEINKYIIGTLNKYDKLGHFSQKGELAFIRYMCGITADDIKIHREEILNTKLSLLKENICVFDGFSERHFKCTFGNKDKISETKELFNKIYYFS